MGKLVQFNQRNRPISAQRDVSADGRVLIFTGVRYERQSDPKRGENERPVRKRRKKHR